MWQFVILKLGALDPIGNKNSADSSSSLWTIQTGVTADKYCSGIGISTVISVWLLPNSIFYIHKPESPYFLRKCAKLQRRIQSKMHCVEYSSHTYSNWPGLDLGHNSMETCISGERVIQVRVLGLTVYFTCPDDHFSLHLSFNLIKFNKHL